MNLIISPRSGNRLYSVRVRSLKQHFIWISFVALLVATIACAGYWMGLAFGHKFSRMLFCLDHCGLDSICFSCSYFSDLVYILTN